jgi:mycoredoxin-dependent peroxiredoxin
MLPVIVQFTVFTVAIMASGEVRESALALRAGESAPDFELPGLVAGVKERFRLSERRGKQNILLAFYPSNWEEVSEKQLRRYQMEREKLLACETEVVGICVDSIMNSTVWERKIGPLDFVLCSDFWPHGQVSLDYGVLRQEAPSSGVCERAIFLVDKAGRVAFQKLYASEQSPDFEDVLQELERLEGKQQQSKTQHPGA